MSDQLQKESRRGRAARAELALVQEHIEEQKQKLFGQFCDPRAEEEVLGALIFLRLFYFDN